MEGANTPDSLRMLGALYICLRLVLLRFLHAARANRALPKVWDADMEIFSS